jgi:hypothetical protein
MSEIKPITLQDIFNAAWQRYIIEKRGPACAEIKGVGRFCVYQTTTGEKCPVGWALPAGHPALSSHEALPRLRHRFPELFAQEIHDMDADRLDTFQALLHDKQADVKTGCWIKGNAWLAGSFTKTAKEYGLKIPGQD